jgi:hypothetical protein
MSNHEDDIRDLFDKVGIDDKPDHRHRDALEQRLLAALTQAPRRQSAQAEIWRVVMNSRITRVAAVAAVLIVILGVSVWSSRPSQSNSMSSFTLLGRSSAAERVLFLGEHIVHIASEIVLYPSSQPDSSGLLRDLEASATYENSVAFIESWLSQRWFPLYSLGADGRTQEHRLEVASSTGKAVTVSDLLWYEPATSCFVRVLKTGDDVLFANAYDGAAVYIAEKDQNGKLQVRREAVTNGFKVPDNPADFMGIAAGVAGSVPDEHYPPIQGVTTERHPDGTESRVYKLGFTDLSGKLNTYFLFKIDADTDVIDEIDCVVNGATARVHRRLLNETVDAPELSWDLAELTATTAQTSASSVEPEDQTNVNVRANKGGQVITIPQIAERATFAAYAFSQAPSWTQGETFYDLPDEGSAPARMFCATYRGKDGRDVVLTQGESFNRYFSLMVREIEKAKEPISWAYESPNGFKVIHQSDRSTEMWWTEVALKSSGFEPKANRVGYVLMSPAKTFMVLAVNGPISKEELHEVIDTLIPAEEYAPTQP